MRLTQYTDYSLRVLMYLGIQPQALVTIQEISERYGISRNHLMKVVHALGQRGYIETVRGKHGGIRLLRPPAEINVGTVTRDMESDFELVECFGRHSACPLDGCCVLAGALDEALQGFIGVLEAYTLEDLLTPRRQLRRALGF